MELSRPTETFPGLWDLTLPVVGFLMLTALALWMIISQTSIWSINQPAPDPLGVSQAAFAQETGIKIMGVAVTAGGGMIDLRYQVVDPDKAVVVHDDENPPGLLIEATGQLINTPYHEHSIFETHTAVTYHELIMNPAGVLKPGTVVSVRVGEAQLEHVVVQ